MPIPLCPTYSMSGTKLWRKFMRSPCIQKTEDSIYVVRSMTDCGLPTADEMINDINKSLHIMSASQPKRGLITPVISNYSRVGGQQDGGSSPGYLSAVLNSAKQKAAGLRWPMGEQFMSSSIPLSPAIDGGDLSTPPETQAEELPVSVSLINEDNDLAATVDEDLKDHDGPTLLESYDKFRSDRETQPEEWLQEET